MDAFTAAAARHGVDPNDLDAIGRFFDDAPRNLSPCSQENLLNELLAADGFRAGRARKESAVEKNETEELHDVFERISLAVSRNRSHGYVVAAAFGALFLAGSTLSAWGVFSHFSEIVLPTLFYAADVLLLRRFLKLRENNRQLKMIPPLLRMAKTREKKEIAADYIERLKELV
jgi:hypothetical protein